LLLVRRSPFTISRLPDARGWTGPACRHGSLAVAHASVSVWRDNFVFADGRRQKRNRKTTAPTVTVLRSNKAGFCSCSNFTVRHVGHRHAGGAFTRTCLCLRVRAPATSGSARWGQGTRADASRFAGLRRTDGRCRARWVSVAAAPTLMWVVARWGAGHARDRKREYLYATRPPHMVGGPTRQPRRASASAARPDSAGAGRGRKR
jgi:hypothetical protein